MPGISPFFKEKGVMNMIEMRNIYKSFGTNLVLDNVNLTLQRGEILALLGENGAGKSTLMNILGGVLPMDSGELGLDGTNVEFHNPADSLNSGIAFIHQELNLVNDVPVYENMCLGNVIMKNQSIPDVKAMRKQSKVIFYSLDINLSPVVMVSSLDASYKQIIEISKAFMMEANYIIMDEPTTSLTDSEIERIFSMMKRVKDQGVGIIFISHKLDEVMEICDRYTVLRNGKMVATDTISTTSIRELARHMVGHDVRDEKLNRDVEYGGTVLKVENLSNDKDFRDISFEVREKEILGITGLLGDGRSQLFLTLFGDMPEYNGDIYVQGKKVNIRSIQDAMKSKIAYLPRNRKENAIIRDLNILENGTIVSLEDYANGLGLISKSKQVKDFDSAKKQLNVKMESHADLITSLSGGNQQKVVLMKWLLSKPK